MQLTLDAASTPRSEEVAVVVHRVAFHHGDAPADDVQVVTVGQRAHDLLVLRSLCREVPNLLLDRPTHIAEGEQLHAEVLRKHDESAPVIGGGLDQGDDLVSKLIEGFDRADVVLQGGDPDSLHRHSPRAASSPMAARAAARRAMGTRNGEQET